MALLRCYNNLLKHLEKKKNQDPINRRLGLEALDQRRVRWSLARKLLFGMEVADLKWVDGTCFLGDPRRRATGVT